MCVKTALCFLVLLQAVACAGDLDDPGRFDGLFDSGLGSADTGTPGDGGGGGGEPNADVPACVTTVLTDRCGTQFCHGAGEPQVDLVSDGLAARLTDAPANAAGPCATESFVATGGGASLLLTKVSDPDTCGAPMPVSGGALAADEIACIESWVVDLGGTAGGQ